MNYSADMSERTEPVFSHNPYHATSFPLLVLDVQSRVCIPPNEGFRMLHWHEEIQFVHVLDGTVHITVYDEEFDLQSGDCMFLNRAVLHHVEGIDDCHYHSFLIPPRMLAFFPGSVMEKQDVEPITGNPALTCCFLKNGVPEHQSFLRELSALDHLYFGNGQAQPPVQRFPESASPKAVYAGETVSDSLRTEKVCSGETASDNLRTEKESCCTRFSSKEKNNRYEYRLSIQLAKLWLEFITLLPDTASAVSSKNYTRIRLLLSIIHRDYRQPLSVADIAAAAHISKTECLRCFRKFVREPPYQYLIKYRLHMSTTLLTTTDRTVTDIALEVGFRCASSYIRYFKEHYRITPHQYRKMHSASGQ